MADRANRRRVQKGVRTGGQFAPRTYSEADLELLEPGEREEVLREVAIDRIVDDMGCAQISPEEAFMVAEKSAHKRAGRSARLDPEEVAQESLAYYLNARKNARTKLWEAHQNGRLVVAGSVLENPGAYINQITDGIVQRMLTGEQQSPTRAAIKIFRQEVKAAEQDGQRELSDAEKDEIAARIIASQPPSRRARVGFHRPVSETPSGNLFHADGSEDIGVVDHAVGADGRILDEGSADSNDFAVGELGDHLLTIMSDGTEGGVRNARRRAWDAIAGRFGAPLVVPDAVSEVQATKARRAIADAGGVMEVAGRWHAKKATAAETNAMFAPFTGPGGQLDYEEQERVVASLHRLGAYADDMFDSALAASTRRREKTKKGAGASNLGTPQLRAS